MPVLGNHCIVLDAPALMEKKDPCSLGVDAKLSHVLQLRLVQQQRQHRHPLWLSPRPSFGSRAPSASCFSCYCRVQLDVLLWMASMTVVALHSLVLRESGLPGPRRHHRTFLEAFHFPGVSCSGKSREKIRHNGPLDCIGFWAFCLD